MTSNAHESYPLFFITGVVLHLDIVHSLRKGKTVGHGGESTFLPVIVIVCLHENVKNTSHPIPSNLMCSCQNTSLS